MYDDSGKLIAETSKRLPEWSVRETIIDDSKNIIGFQSRQVPNLPGFNIDMAFKVAEIKEPVLTPLQVAVTQIFSD